jgi:hypothetical protein
MTTSTLDIAYAPGSFGGVWGHLIALAGYLFEVAHLQEATNFRGRQLPGQVAIDFAWAIFWLFVLQATIGWLKRSDKQCEGNDRRCGRRA